MARTWSNRKRPVETLSAAQRARQGRPSSLTLFLVILIAASIFFLGLTLYSTYHVLRHPLTEVYQTPTDHPKED